MGGAIKRLADAFVRVWEETGQFGQLVNVKTGTIHVGGSTAGAIAPAGLALASTYFHDPKYLKVAEEAARMFYHRDVQKGYTTGGPGEILQCPDSESAFAMLESFVVLYEVTGQREWLTAACDMAAICSSWVVSYDFLFPPNSTLGRAQARSTGAVWASVQNKHAGPGVCTSSGDCLLKLYRATGDRRYLDLLKDISHNLLEFVSTSQRPVGADKDGYISERVNLSDWEGTGGVGQVHWTSVSWCELAVMLTAIEVPGIYVQPDTGLLYVFDHVDAQIMKAPANSGSAPCS